MYQELVLDPFLILVNNPKQPLHARNYFKNKIFLKEDYQKGFKKLTLFFLSNSLIDKVIINTRCLELVALQVTKQVQKNSFTGYILSGKV